MERGKRNERYRCDKAGMGVDVGTEIVCEESSFRKFYIVFHVFWGGEPDFSAFFSCTGRKSYLAGPWAGFFISAVGFPVMGVAAVALAGGLHELAGRVERALHPHLFLCSTLPSVPFWRFQGLPATSFEMTVIPALSSLGISLGGQGGMIRFLPS